MPGKKYVEDRQLVTPGDLLAEGEYKIVNPAAVYRKGDKYYAAVIGLAQVSDDAVNVIPLEGFYYPNPGDVVVGVIVNVGITNWEVDIKAPFTAILYAADALGRPVNPAKEDLTHYLDVGDIIVAKIEAFDRTRNPVLTIRGKGLGKVNEGAIIEISPVKVPRVIGKKASMLQTLQKETGCDIVIGKNGRIIIKCRNPDMQEILMLAIRKIERESHIPGLTDRIKEFILKEKVRRGLVSG